MDNGYDPEVCNNCGKCCHVPVMMGGKPKALRTIVCKYLEVNRSDSTQTRCSIYHKRFAKVQWCMSVPEAISQERLPKDCPFVKDDEEYIDGIDYCSPVEEDVVMMVPHNFIPLKAVKATKIWDGPMGDN